MTSDTKNSPNSRLFGCDKVVAQTMAALASCYKRHGKLLVCGNGGSAADAEHIVGNDPEPLKRFVTMRLQAKDARDGGTELQKTH